MANVPLAGKVSSLFDVPEKRELLAHGSSITSFAYEPGQDDMPKRSKKAAYENTYIMEPADKFKPEKVKPIIDKVLEANLQGRKYSATECALLSKSLAEDIKLQVKELNFDRYKIISVVTIGEIGDKGVSVMASSRFLWDTDRDNFSASSWKNRDLYAVSSVYAVYYE